MARGPSRPVVTAGRGLRPEPKGLRPLGARAVRLCTGGRLLAQSASGPVARVGRGMSERVTSLLDEVETTVRHRSPGEPEFCRPSTRR